LLALSASLVCAVAHAAPIDISNTTVVDGSDGHDYTAVSPNFDTTRLGLTGGSAPTGFTLSLDYTTTFNGSATIGGVTANYADIFLRAPDAGYSSAPFTYAISLGDQAANGGQAAGLYSPKTVATSQSIWASRTGYVYGMAYSATTTSTNYAAPVVMTSGTEVAGTSVATVLTDTGKKLAGQELYTLDVTLSGLSWAMADTLEKGFDIFWGTADCANGAFLATDTSPLFKLPEPPAAPFAAMGWLMVVLAKRRLGRGGLPKRNPPCGA